MHIGMKKNPSKTECVFSPPPGFFNTRTLPLTSRLECYLIYSACYMQTTAHLFLNPGQTPKEGSPSSPTTFLTWALKCTLAQNPPSPPKTECVFTHEHCRSLTSPTPLWPSRKKKVRKRDAYARTNNISSAEKHTSSKQKEG